MLKQQWTILNIEITQSGYPFSVFNDAIEISSTFNYKGKCS